MALEEAALLKIWARSLEHFFPVAGFAFKGAPAAAAISPRMFQLAMPKLDTAVEINREAQIAQWSASRLTLQAVLLATPQSLMLEPKSVSSQERDRFSGTSNSPRGSTPKSTRSPSGGNLQLGLPRFAGDMQEVRFVEVHGPSWTKAADAIAEKLSQDGVECGQVLSVDAHAQHPEHDVVFSAHYCMRLPGRGALSLGYKIDEAPAGDFSWETLYRLGKALEARETMPMRSRSTR